MLGSILKDLFLPKKIHSKAPVESNFAITVADVIQADGGSILCFTSASEGNALAIGTQWVLAPFKEKASSILFFDLYQPGWQRLLEDALTGPVWFAVAFFGTGENVTVSRAGARVNLWEAYGIPFVRLYADIPAYFPDRHVTQFRNSINGYFDSSHINFYRRWFPNPALSVLLPPQYTLDPIPLDQVDRASKLKGPIIFPKNGNAPSRLIDYWRRALPALLAKNLEATAEESISQKWINKEPRFDELLLKHFDGLGIDLSAKPAVLCFFVAQLDDYVRRVKSTMIAEALMDLPVMIRGRYWEHLDFKGKPVTYVPDSDVAKTQALMDQALAVIDMSPNTQYMVHDRITRAAGRGTAFLTNKQASLDKLLPATERFTFNFEHDAIRTLVEHYLAHPHDAVELGIEQSMALRAAYREEDFVNTLLAAVETCAFHLGGRPEGTQNFLAFPPTSYG